MGVRHLLSVLLVAMMLDVDRLSDEKGAQKGEDERLEESDENFQ